MNRPEIPRFLVYAIIFLMGPLAPLSMVVSGQSNPVFVIADAVTVKGPEIHFSDLGTLRNGTEEDRRNLQQITLGAAPLPGQVRKLSRSYLELLLKQHQTTGDLALEMGDQVEIRVAAVCIKAADLEAAVQKLIPAKKSQIIKEWLELRNLPEAIWLSNSDWRIEASQLNGIPELGPVLFKVILTNGNERRVLNLSGRIHATALVYKARRDLPRFTELDPEDFEAVESGLTNGSELLGTLPAGMRTTKPFHRGEILRSDQIQTIPLVQKGQEVGVIVKSDRLEIRIIGIAKSDGWLNDWIQLQNPSSRKLFRGKVIGKDLVEVVPK